jgi:transposase InsO family protein
MSRETSTGVATVTQLGKTFGISRAAYYAAKKPRPARVIAARHAPRYTSSEVALAAIREVIRTERAWGVRKVWATLKRHGLKVSRKRVHALMRANGLVLARDSEPGEPLRGHVVVPEPNRGFGGDLTTVWTKKDGWVAVVPTIDCGCRSVLGLKVTKDQNGPAVLASIEEALRKAFGEPKFVPSASSCAPTTCRSTRGRTAPSSSRSGGSSTPSRPWGGRLAMPSLSGSSGR